MWTLEEEIETNWNVTRFLGGFFIHSNFYVNFISVAVM
jgi:hypothetical protein